MRMALTEDRIAKERARHQRAGGGHEVLWDTTQRGLGVRLRNSSASYLVRGRHGGKPVWLSIGPVEAVTLKAARDAAKGHLGDWARKLDPRAERRADREKAKRAKFTLADAWALYLEHPETRSSRAKHRTNNECLYRLHLEPKLGKLRIPDGLTTKRVSAWYADLAEKLPTTANRARALLSTVLNRGADDHLGAAGNPCRKVKPGPENGRSRRLTPDELKAFWRALRTMADEPGADRIGLAAVEFTLLSGMRHGETAAMEWAWLSNDGALLTIPAAAHKTGRTKGDKRIPLGAPARALLAGLRAQVAPGQAFVFPDEHGHRRRTLDRVWCDLRTRIGAAGLHLHDLRREWVSQGVAAGLTLVVLGRVVGHTSQFMTEKYLTLEDADGAAAADRVASRIASYAEDRPPAAVVPLRG
jgi:integrase